MFVLERKKNKVFLAEVSRIKMTCVAFRKAELDLKHGGRQTRR